MGKSAVLAVLLLAAACSSKSRCRQICQNEAQCSESRDAPMFDQSECFELCSDLERDTAGRDVVRRHQECVEKARDCREILSCP